MGKLLNELKKQLELKEFHDDAEKCIKIYEELRSSHNGSVWSSDWAPLTIVIFRGTYPNSKRIHKPSGLGHLFLEQLERR